MLSVAMEWKTLTSQAHIVAARAGEDREVDSVVVCRKLAYEIPNSLGSEYPTIPR